MNNNWNANNRGWGGPKRGGRGRGRGGGGGNRGSWSRNNFRDQQTPFGNNRGGFRGGNRSFGDRNPNRPWQNRPKMDHPGKRLSEAEIGVTEYLSNHEGFNGIIKCRYSDFQVSEINDKGEIAKLTDTSVPELPTDDSIKEDEDLLLSKYNLEILPMETWDRINELAVSFEPTSETVEVDVTGMTKEQRTQIHDAVKKAFGKSIVGSTVTVDDKKVVQFQKFRKGVRRDNRVKWMWPGKYVYFIVHKENCDTMEAAARLADRLKLNIKPSLFGYAGTKDRRAKTSQWFSLRRVEPARIAAAAAGLREIQLGNFSFNDYNLKLGGLRGNRFRIALRNVTAADDAISEACERLRTLGFVNYYGLQRFGTRADVPTYVIGRKMLQGNFREAINLILQDRESQRGSGIRGEDKLQRALDRNPRDLLGALAKLSRNQRILYLHSYQSLQWNRCVSLRLQRHGARPAPGDLVPLAVLHHTEEEEDDEESGDDENNEDKHQDENDEQKEDTEKPTTDNDSEKPDEKTEKESEKELENESENASKPSFLKNAPKPKIPVKVLTEEDIESGRYTIFDVVMPLPGSNVEYPPNMKDYYTELLEKDDLKLDMLHKNKSYTLGGAYRYMLVRPGELQWRCVRYDEPYCDLQLSDVQELRGHADTGIVPDGKYKALLLTMTLPSSSYATMALRELLKVDTSNDNQAQQNNYFKIKPKDGADDKEEGKNDNVKKEETVECVREENNREELIARSDGNAEIDQDEGENVNRGEKRKAEENVVEEDACNQKQEEAKKLKQVVEDIADNVDNEK